MRRVLWGVWLAAACSGDGGGKDADGTDTGTNPGTTNPGTPCSPAVENDLPDVFALMRDDERYCESARYYDPNQTLASAHWFSEITIDGCDEVSGYELAMLFPNPRAESAGLSECEVVWQITGVKDEARVGGADFGLQVELNLDVVRTTCDPNPFEGFEFQEAHYNVALEGDTSRFFFDSGTEFAAGYGNASHLSWFFDECKLF